MMHARCTACGIAMKVSHSFTQAELEVRATLISAVASR
jgi:hypothetical protein